MVEDDQQLGGDASVSDALVAAQAEQVRAETERAKAEANKAAAEARRLDAEADKLRAETAGVSAETERADVEKEKLRAEAARAKADEKRADAESRKIDADLMKLAAEGQRAAENKEFAESMNEAAEHGPDVRAFVRQSLLDIMAGVDDAAAMGRTRAFNDGLDGYLPAITKIGGTHVEGLGTDLVEFDLTVTVTQSGTKQTSGGGKGEGGFRLGVLGFGKLHVGASGHIEHTIGGASSDVRTNRLRFSVPISYAMQDDPPDED